MTHARRMVLSLAAFLVLPVGCGGDGGSAKGPTDYEIFLVQRSGSATGSVSQAVEAASAGILASGSGSSAPGPHAVPVYPGATPAFDFAADVDAIFDFDALDADGNDRFPNTSGQIHVTATGAKSGTADAGDASFSATITTETDVTMMDPDSGTLTTIPSGASWSYQLTVVWSVTDSENWTVTATATTDIDVPNVTVDDGFKILTINVLGQREVVSSFTRQAGRLSHERTFEGSLTTTVDDGTTTETVTLVFDKPGKVRISLLGHVFGPMSEGQVRALFHTVIT
ncbi:MAG TPA: hypothetical protein VK661_07410 [Planctomycetota bacterium]|nr:hypothetical protein [Planctomycetota bacterium]